MPPPVGEPLNSASPHIGEPPLPCFLTEMPEIQCMTGVRGPEDGDPYRGNIRTPTTLSSHLGDRDSVASVPGPGDSDPYRGPVRSCPARSRH